MAFVYILANRKSGALYVGVTKDLLRRLDEHARESSGGFCGRYGVDRLVYFEIYDRNVDAIAREKQLKNWQRAWKVTLIEQNIPDWEDVSASVPYM